MQLVVMLTLVLKEHACWDIITLKLDLDQTSVVLKHTESERHKCNKTHFLLHNLVLFACYDCLSDSDDICDPKWLLKCPRNFQPPPSAKYFPKYVLYFLASGFTMVELCLMKDRKDSLGQIFTRAHTYTHTHIHTNTQTQQMPILRYKSVIIKWLI